VRLCPPGRHRDKTLMAHLIRRSVGRARRLWLTEALLIAAILVFGGFALLADARLSPAELLSGLNTFVAR